MKKDHSMLDRQRLWLLELRTELKTVHFNISIFSPSRGLNCLTSETELAFDNCVARLGNILVCILYKTYSTFDQTIHVWENCRQSLVKHYYWIQLIPAKKWESDIWYLHLIDVINTKKIIWRFQSKVPEIPVVIEWKINIWLAFPKNIEAQRNMKLVLVC